MDKFDSIIAFSAITKIPVTFYDEEGKKCWESYAENRICNFSSGYMDKNTSCYRNLTSSMKYAARLGEPYIFLCESGLTNIAVSLLMDGKTKGCFVAGPFIMGCLRESNIAKILKISGISAEQYPKLILFLNRLNTYTPQDVTNLSLLLFNSVLSVVRNPMDYIKNRQQFKKQTDLSLNLYNKTSKERDYPYELENQMIQKVKKAEAEEAINILKKLIYEIYFLESGNINAIKAKIFGLTAILKREISELDLIQDYDLDDINNLYEEQNLEGLIQQAAQIIESLSSIYAGRRYSGNSKIIADTIRIIHKIYTQKCSLKTIADELHVNPSYLSVLFKKEMGISFTEYIGSVRINESKRLLKESNLDMIDIAISCGFDDQSYFTKVFKKNTGKTPKQYRYENMQR